MAMEPSSPLVISVEFMNETVQEIDVIPRVDFWKMHTDTRILEIRIKATRQTLQFPFDNVIGVTISPPDQSGANGSPTKLFPQALEKADAS